MRKYLFGLWAAAVTAVVLYLGLGIGLFFLRDAADRRRVDELARAQVAKDYPAATVTDVAVQLRREHGDVREYAVDVTLYMSGDAREAKFTCSSRHAHFLRWWSPTQQVMAAAKAG